MSLGSFAPIDLLALSNWDSIGRAVPVGALDGLSGLPVGRAGSRFRGTVPYCLGALALNLRVQRPNNSHPEFKCSGRP